MSKKIDTVNRDKPTAFAFWFYLFGLAFVAILIYYGTVTVYSAHALCGMIFVRQLSLISSTHAKDVEHDKAIEELSARLAKIEPYQDE